MERIKKRSEAAVQLSPKSEKRQTRKMAENDRRPSASEPEIFQTSSIHIERMPLLSKGFTKKPKDVIEFSSALCMTEQSTVAKDTLIRWHSAAQTNGHHLVIATIDGKIIHPHAFKKKKEKAFKENSLDTLKTGQFWIKVFPREKFFLFIDQATRPVEIGTVSELCHKGLDGGFSLINLISPNEDRHGSQVLFETLAEIGFFGKDCTHLKGTFTKSLSDKDVSEARQRLLSESIDLSSVFLLRKLLEDGAMADEPDYSGYFPFHSAQGDSKIEHRNILIQYGADPDQTPIEMDP